MADVRLLFEQSVGPGGSLRIDLFNRALPVENIGSTVQDSAKLLATDLQLSIEKGVTVPAPGAPAMDVPATVKILGPSFAEIPDIKVVLRVRRDSNESATIVEVLSFKQAWGTFEWRGLQLRPCVAKLRLGALPWRLDLTPESGQPVASFKLLGTEFEVLPLESASATEPALSFSASGVSCSCSASEETRKQLAARLAKLTGSGIRIPGIKTCRADITDDAYSLHLTAAFSIPAFSGGDGELDFTASRRAGGEWTVEAAVTLNNDRRWTDPFGWFQIDKPRLDLRFRKDEVDDVRLGGKITFLPERLGSLDRTVADWFGDLFKGISTEFDTKFGSVRPKIELRPLSPFKLKALEMFELKVPRIDLQWIENEPAFELDGIELRLDIGDVGLRGTLPKLRFEPGGGLNFAAGGNGDLKVDLAMSAPGGVKGSAKVRYVDTGVLRALEGKGQLSTPVLPGVAVAFRVGQFRAKPTDAWIPTLLLYADAPTRIVLFPMVTVQRMGLGLGVNCEVEGTSRLTLAQARKRVEQGLPDVSKVEVWKPSKDTALTLLARLFVGPGPDESIIGFYAADMTVIITSQAQVSAFGKLWLYTKVQDARSSDYQQRPAALGLMMLDGQESSLRIAAQTTNNGLSSLDATGLSGKLMGFGLPPMRLAFEATRNGIALVLGPNEMQGNVGPLSVSASSLLAFRARTDGGNSYVISKSSLRAVFDWSASASVGPVSLSGSFHAGFAADLHLFGLFGSRKFDGNQELLVYGRSSIVMSAALSLHASVGFSITIDCWFDSYTISWSIDYDFRLDVHVDLSLELSLSTKKGIGMVGHAKAYVDVLGVSASLTVPLSVDSGDIDEARAAFVRAENDIRELIGA